MTDKKLSLAIVGCGQIVTHHLEAIGATDKFHIRVLCDPSEHRRTVIRNLLPAVTQKINKNDDDDCCNDTTIIEYNTLDELISATVQVDVIFIAVPHDLHETLAMQALNQTTSFIVMEKPLAPTLESCNRLIQASKDHPMRLYIAEQSPYWPAVLKAKEMIHNQGAIGTVVSAAAYYYESMRDNITSGSVEDGGGLGWRGSIKRAGGGIAIDGGLHWIRPLREVCGKVVQVTGIIRPNLAPSLQMEGEALGHALLEIQQQHNQPTTTSSDGSDIYLKQPENSGPLVATYSCNMLATAPMAHDRCPYFRFTGNKGELIILGNGLDKISPDGAGNLVWYHDGAPQGEMVLSKDETIGGFFRGFEGLWQSITRTIQTQDTDAAHESVIRAADDVKVVLALYRSSKSRKWELTDP